MSACREGSLSNSLAAKAAGGTPNEMKIAAGDSMADVIKAKGGQEGEYRWQMKARDDALAVVRERDVGHGLVQVLREHLAAPDVEGADGAVDGGGHDR